MGHLVQSVIQFVSFEEEVGKCGPYKINAFHVHDEILEINGHSLEGVSTENIQRYLMFVRAMFDYNPYEDDELPFRDIGQAFEMGDILELVDCSDFTWWQVIAPNLN
ncbi:unnamed protein product [Dibothriocephalus latus]|uniref:SH3 domain-containing protein n=1 Tax=Dibothriocephalus latus TaxID=60516 RepID=A0A3P7NLV4_DIBLA|nr:unnamed protein product [Dibothriocephalus latus]